MNYLFLNNCKRKSRNIFYCKNSWKYKTEAENEKSDLFHKQFGSLNVFYFLKSLNELWNNCIVQQNSDPVDSYIYLYTQTS